MSYFCINKIKHFNDYEEVNFDFTLMDSKSLKDFSQFANDVSSLTIFKKQLQKNKKCYL